jgi:hypothetical protein
MGAVQYDHQDESEKRLNPSTVGLHDYDHALCLPVVYRIIRDTEYLGVAKGVSLWLICKGRCY